MDRHCCFAQNSRDALDVEGSLVGREHERVRSRVTAPGDVATGDQSSDSHLDADIGVRVTSQPFFLSRRLVQLHVQAEHVKRRKSTVAFREGGKASKDKGRRLELLGDGVILWYPS